MLIFIYTLATDCNWELVVTVRGHNMTLGGMSMGHMHVHGVLVVAPTLLWPFPRTASMVCVGSCLPHLRAAHEA